MYVLCGLIYLASNSLHVGHRWEGEPPFFSMNHSKLTASSILLYLANFSSLSPSLLSFFPPEPFSVKMLCLVCLTTDYPATPPSFVVRIQTSSKKKEFEPHDIHVKVT